MFLPDGPRYSRPYEAFIIGSGPAGITIATALAERNKRVLVFESGEVGSARAELSNAIGYGHYSGEYWNLHSTRSFGGTSDVWSGWCTTLRELDFDNPAVGVAWPISRRDLAPYYSRAAPILDRDAAFLDFETPLLPGFTYRPVSVEAPTRFGSKYLDAVKNSPLVHVAPGCSVVGLEANGSRTVVTGLAYVQHRRENTIRLALQPAQQVVLAAGGMGNARLLLQPRTNGEVPIGNESGQVGRFLMEHPHFHRAGECAVDIEVDRYWPAENRGHGVHAVIADEALSRERGLYGCSLQWSRKTTDHDMARYLATTHKRPFYHYAITARAEMLPVESNRVFLTAERDALGFHRPAARCIVDARDYLNVEQSLRLLGETLIKLGRGRVRVNNDRIYKQVAGGGHIMGTTRMGRDRATSVVDEDCRVHGYENFFVAGSSVFPSGGFANPTLTIVALALRLADKLAQAG
jgi:choline dehydrogenase-like flavoprotein